MLRLDWNLVLTIINLIVLYLLLKKFLFKPVLSIMEKREKMIQDSIASARSQEGQAQELKEHYEQALVSARDESAQIVEKARVDAQKEYDRILADADVQAKNWWSRRAKMPSWTKRRQRKRFRPRWPDWLWQLFPESLRTAAMPEATARFTINF